MSRTPPRDADLDAALALGGTRIATAAHPLCRCGQRKPPVPQLDITLDIAEAHRVRHAADKQWRAEHGSPRDPVYIRRDCPMHTGTAGGA